MTRSKREYQQLSAEALSAIGLPPGEHLSDPEMRFAAGKASRLNAPIGTVWVKVYEQPNIRLLQRWVRTALNALPAATLAKTGGGDQEKSLLRQAAQAEVLREAGFNTPKTVFVSSLFHITNDVGPTLADLLSRLKQSQALDNPDNADRKAFEQILVAATAELDRLHKAGLAHGRPKLRDFSWHVSNAQSGGHEHGMPGAEGKVFIFDLDEHPWEEMAMADAQGRDIVLWMLDVCQQKVPTEIARRLCRQLLSSASADSFESVRKTRKALAPVAPIAGLLLKLGVRSRELQGGLEAYKLIKHYFDTEKQSS